MAKNKKPAKKPAAKPVAKKAPPVAKPAPAKPAEEGKSASALKAARDDLRSRILGRKASKPIAFSLDEVREIAKTNAGKPVATPAKGKLPAAKAPGSTTKLEDIKAAAKPSHVKAASLADVLGFNPRKTQKSAE